MHILAFGILDLGKVPEDMLGGGEGVQIFLSPFMSGLFLFIGLPPGIVNGELFDTCLFLVDCGLLIKKLAEFTMMTRSSLVGGGILIFSTPF